MEALYAFLPIDRRIALANGKDLPRKADGAVLFADIAGFTPLTERLAQELGERRGPEELTHHLNLVFGGLIRAVHAQRGCVIAFGGDAITCWFQGDSGLRAASCALAMRETLREQALIETPAGSRIELEIKIAIATGPLQRYVVGDPALRRLDVLAGRTLDWMASAEKATRRGEITVTAEAAAGLGELARLGEWRESPAGRRLAVLNGLSATASPEAWPSDDVQTDSTYLAEWVWPSVRERLLHDRSGYLAELRPVVALYVTFAGIDYDHDVAAADRLDGFIRTLESILDQHEGTLLDISVGDKGSNAIAAFGAPTTFNDDAARAIAAAMALVDAYRDAREDLELRIGLARGPMRTGAYGSPERATYSVMGEHMNLGARLMVAAAPGEIICDEGVQMLARRHWAMEALAPIRVKGKSEPVAIFRPTGERAPAASSPTRLNALIGRRKEIGQLEAALAEARQGVSCVVSLVGEGGIGKSRLIAELLETVRAAGLTSLFGAGQSIEQHSAYRAWRDVLMHGFGLTELGDRRAQRRRVESWFAASAPNLRERIPLLDDILALGWQDNALTSGLDPALRRDSLADLVLAVLRDWGRGQPCIIVLDDAQWLDELSWALTLDVVRGMQASRSPLFLLIASRPEGPQSKLQRDLRQLRSSSPSRQILLDGLADDEVVHLAAQSLGLRAASLPEQISTWVCERAEGNPFFAQELVLALRDRGALSIVRDAQSAEGASNHCEVTDDLEATLDELPSDVTGLVLARIDRLPLEIQGVMKMASVIGRSFALPPLLHALERTGQSSRDAVLNALEQLQAEGLTQLESTEPIRSFAFSHVITQETTYGTLLFEQRRRMHETVAAWYESSAAGRGETRSETTLASMESHYPILAHHYQYAEKPDRERRYRQLAGESAARRYANADALGFFARALALTEADDVSLRYAILRAREEVLDRLGERDAQTEDLEAMQQLMAKAAEARWRAELALRQANFAIVTSEYSAAVDAAREGESIAKACQDQPLRLEALVTLGKIEWQRGDLPSAHDRLQEALHLTESFESPRSRAEVLRNLGSVHTYQGQFDQALALQTEALDLFRAIDDRVGIASCLASLAATAGQAGTWDKAAALNHQAIAACRQIGHRRGLSIVEGNLGSLLLMRGDYASGQSYLNSAHDTCRALGDRWGESTALDNLGLLRHQCGDLDAAASDLRSAIAIQREIEDGTGLGYSLTHLGDLALDRGDLPLAARSHEEAMAIRRELGQEILTLDNRAGLARIALAEADLDLARSQVEVLQAWIGENGTEGIEYPVWVLWTCWRVLEATGDRARARAALEAAHDLVLEDIEDIAGADQRRMFLENVSHNLAVLADWAGLQQATDK